jgi:hypothetical protein
VLVERLATYPRLESGTIQNMLFQEFVVSLCHKACSAHNAWGASLFCPRSRGRHDHVTAPGCSASSGHGEVVPEVADAGPVFNVADFGAVAGGHTDNSKVVFSDNFCSPADDIFHLAVQS